MSLNREKIACCVALLIFLGGMYTVVLSFIKPTQVRRPPNTTIARIEREVFMSEPRGYVGGEDAGRNPFSFSEGWKDLDAVPLRPPTIPERSRILPGLSGGVSPVDGGIYFSEESPKEVDAGTGAGTGAGTSAGAGTGTGTAGAPVDTTGVVPVPKGGLLPVQGAGDKKGGER